MSSIGIGNTRVDLVLTKSSFVAGEAITGELRVEGGMLDQKINQVYLKLLLTSRYRTDDQIKQVNKEFDHEVIATGFEVTAGDKIQPIPVKYVLPENIPVTTSNTKYYLITGLDVAKAVDPKDSDQIEVLPGHRQSVIMQAIEQNMGFRRKQNTGEFNGRAQEFEYYPTDFMRGKLDELEVIYLPQQDGVKLYLQIDKKSRGLMGMLSGEWDLDERNVSVLIPNEQITTPAEVASQLSRIIEKEYNKIL